MSPGLKYNDDITGNEGNNVLSGLQGNDELYGYWGRDRLLGGAGGGDTCFMDFPSEGAVVEAILTAAVRPNLDRLIPCRPGTSNPRIASSIVLQTRRSAGVRVGRPAVGARAGSRTRSSRDEDGGGKMFRMRYATRMSGENTFRRGRLASTAVAATAAMLTASLLLWPAGSARAATPTCLGQAATIVGSSGDDDPLLGTSGDDVIVGRGGNDVIRGDGGNDLICANRGSDTLRGGGGDDSLSGGAGNDRFLGGFGEDTADYSQSYFPSTADGVNVNLATGAGDGRGSRPADRPRGRERLQLRQRRPHGERRGLDAGRRLRGRHPHRRRVGGRPPFGCDRRRARYVGRKGWRRHARFRRFRRRRCALVRARSERRPHRSRSVDGERRRRRRRAHGLAVLRHRIQVRRRHHRRREREHPRRRSRTRRAGRRRTITTLSTRAAATIRSTVVLDRTPWSTATGRRHRA